MCDFFENGWLLLHPNDPTDPDYVPIAFDNEAFTAPTSWVRVSVVNTVRQQTTSGPNGTRRVEQRGRLAVQLFADVDQGGLDLAGLADDVRKVLEGKAITVLDEDTGTTEQIALFETSSSPAPTDGRWTMGIAVTTFLYQSKA